MASRSIYDLDKRVIQAAQEILLAWKAAGLDIKITCTYRSDEEQAELYEQGRSMPGKKVTNAKAGESLHNHRLALDFVIMVNGEVSWDDKSPLWEEAARIAQNVDPRLSWGGDWKKKDLPHLEWGLGNLGSKIT